MTAEARRGSRPRVPLSRDRVLRAAVRVADEGGVESLTMRRLAEEVGAEAMSLYYHVDKKEDILDGLVDVVASEINDAVGQIRGPAAGAAWKQAMRRRILAARQIFLTHPWAPAVFASRTSVSPQVLRYMDGVIAIMRDGGFSYDTAHHALHALGSRALGFTQEMFTPSDAAAGDQDTAALQAMADQFPHLVGMLADVVHDDPDSTLGWCDDQAEFEFGLDIILDGLDRLRELPKFNCDHSERRRRFAPAHAISARPTPRKTDQSGSPHIHQMPVSLTGTLRRR